MNEKTPAKAGSVAEAIGVVAWSYVFLHLDINLGSINILPEWACYALVLSALPGLAKAERSALLLRPLGIILLVVSLIEWGLQILGMTLDFYLVNMIVAALSLYFHFQLLTNVADIAARFDDDKARRIKRLRNFRTVFSTILALPWPLDRLPYGQTAFAVAGLVVAVVIIIWSLGTLFDLKNDPRLAELGEETV